MKKYKAVFFDWDGTAVFSRTAPVDQVVVPMKKLLAEGVKLAVISGTTINNIGGGKLHEYFTLKERQNLFYGLGRGAYNYHFTDDGRPEVFCSLIPDKELMLRIHRACYRIHERLLQEFDFKTDIVFSRPNYCKIDILVENDRNGQLFFQEHELDSLNQTLKEHGIGDLRQLIRLAEEIGREEGLSLSATTDAKYLEVGLSSKSDNVNAILERLGTAWGIQAEDCSFWGDEYIGLSEGLFGSDSFMITERTMAGDFFDVSEARGERPENVQVLGGGVEQFIGFLEAQSNL